MTFGTWMSAVRSLSCLAIFAACGAGCVTTTTAQRIKESPTPAPNDSVHQVHAAWENRIVTNQDVTKNGATLLGIGGRVYLFGEEIGFPTLGDGAVVVELSDVGRLDQQGKPQLLERWEIDPNTLKRLARKDMIGWGYTLFLPWNTYRRDLTKVQMQVKYIPAKGTPLFSPPSVVALRDDTRLTVTRRQTIPGGIMPAAAIVPPPVTSPPVVPPAARP